MNNGNDRTPVLKNEDWWAVFIGLFIVLLAIVGWLPHAPKIAKWTSLAAAFPKGASTIGTTVALFIFICVITMIGGAFMKFDLKRYIPGFIVIFALTFIAILISNQAFIKKWGIEYVLWALVFGLIISNFFKVPQILRAAGQTEFFIKIGLVCMGANIFFTDVLKGGFVGLIQAVLVATSVWFMTYWICRRFRVSERFSAIIASANAICGVSATIAAGGAIQGNKKEVSYMIAWVLVCAVILILVMPPIAKWMNLPNNWAGAWVGGVIDNTGAVVAAGGVIGGDAAYKVAAMVKMAQNVLIGLAAFLMALWATMSLDRKEAGDMERPSFMEIWYRFPKFVLGFVLASLIISFVAQPAMGAEAAKKVGSLCKNYRNWFFALCFVSIGLETNFKELVSVGGGRPAAAYWISQTANAIWTLFITWILWSGTFFTAVIPPD
ncbi:MAG: putative sulfate exporter family transporter [Candidatus Aminicenantes bacterium]|nr:MAG: putative sulfate exporter family transporter [Candidatus Aminicenantes bacterium]